MNRVQLVRSDVAYLYLTFANLPLGATAQVQVDESAWADVDLSQLPSGRPRLLLRGPDAPNGSGLTVSSSGPIRVRFTSSPESRTVSAGYLTLVQPSE